MTKKVTFNGIEMSLSEYDASVASLLDYLEKVVGRLEDGLDKVDGKFHLSINVDFSPNNPPIPSISSNSSTNNQTNEKVAKILERTAEVENNHVLGSIKVNLLVEDKNH
jgi:hypothetical protein